MTQREITTNNKTYSELLRIQICDALKDLGREVRIILSKEEFGLELL